MPLEEFSIVGESPGFKAIPPKVNLPNKPDCPACGSNDTTAYYPAPESGTEYDLSALDCNNCGAEYDLPQS